VKVIPTTLNQTNQNVTQKIGAYGF